MSEGHTDARPEPRSQWQEALADRFWARWRLWLVLAVVVFALNTFVGLLAGGLGLIAFANRVAGRALRAKRLVEQARQIAATPEDRA